MEHISHNKTEAQFHGVQYKSKNSSHTGGDANRTNQAGEHNAGQSLVGNARSFAYTSPTFFGAFILRSVRPWSQPCGTLGALLLVALKP